MRIALLVHGLPPEHCTGVEVHALALARALAERGHEIECFTQVTDHARPHLSQERCEFSEGVAITRLAVNVPAQDERGRRIVRGAAEAFARFLDREKPDVVHVEHALRVGPAALHAVRERALPLVVQAHDPLAISLDHLLLRTDGAPLALAADGRPTADALARNALGRACLERALNTGEHGAVVLSELLPQPLADELAQLLDGELEGQRADEHERLVRELARETDEWCGAFAVADLFCASSEGLGEMLRQGGVRVDRVVPCGIDARGLRRLRDKRSSRADSPLRFGVLGGLRPHKGAQVALDAFAILRESGVVDVELALRGEGEGLETRALQARAADLGAECSGAFDPTDLPRLLAELDCLLVPSIWPENAPFVIREAFAGGIPVIASDIGALPESLAHGGGLSVAANDAPALAACMSSLIADRAAFDELRASIPMPLSIEVEAARWVMLYGSLVDRARAERDRARAALPAHLADFAARTSALERAPLRDLVARALDGIDELSAQLAPGAQDRSGAALAGALEALDGPREALAEAARHAAWNASIADERGSEVGDLERALVWREEQLKERESRLAWREERLLEIERERDWTAEQLAAREDAVRAAEAEREEARVGRESAEQRADWLAERVEVLEREAAWLREGSERAQAALDASSAAQAAGETERAWLRDSLADREAHLAEAQRALADLQAALTALEAERDWKQAAASAAEERADALEQRAQAGESRAKELEGRLERTAAELAVTGAHSRFLREELVGFARALGVKVADDAQLPTALGAARAELGRRTRELAWRAEEMALAAGEASRGLAKHVGAAALRRAREWTEGDQA
jgi:glycosyltransferase involved in cell wall biosynthesis